MSQNNIVVPAVGLRIRIKPYYGCKSMEATIVKIQKKDMNGVVGTCVLLDEFFDFDVFRGENVSDLYYREDIGKWFCWSTSGDFILHVVGVNVSLAE